MRTNLIFSFVIIVLIISINLVFALNDKSFETNTLIIKSSVKKGESTSNPISILNHKEQKFSLEHSSENNFISLDSGSFTLNGEEGVTFNVISRSEGLSEGVYSGKVLIKGEDEGISVPVILEVESGSLSFDVSSEISPRFLQISPGGYSYVDLVVYNLNSENRGVSLEYGIKDLNGKTIVSEEQILDVKTRVQLTKNLLIPQDTRDGDYVFYAYAVDLDTGATGVSSSLFGISSEILTSPDEGSNSGNYLGAAFFIILVLILSFLIINYYWNKRLINNSQEWNQKLLSNSDEWNNKLESVKRVKFGSIGREIRKLESKAELLEQAYRKGYIKKASFEDGRARIEELISKLKRRL